MGRLGRFPRRFSRCGPRGGGRLRCPTARLIRCFFRFRLLAIRRRVGRRFVGRSGASRSVRVRGLAGWRIVGVAHESRFSASVAEAVRLLGFGGKNANFDATVFGVIEFVPLAHWAIPADAVDLEAIGIEFKLFNQRVTHRLGTR